MHRCRWQEHRYGFAEHLLFLSISIPPMNLQYCHVLLLLVLTLVLVLEVPVVLRGFGEIGEGR